MNRSKIEWCDYTWNPAPGCWGPGGTAEKPNRCSYCYAHKLANRFYGPQITGSGQDWNLDAFGPHFYPERLDQPAKVKKPSRIFVCSMGDLFGDWVPREWILTIKRIATEQWVESPLGDKRLYAVTYGAPRHTFIFLTKNPTRYAEFNPWPDNCWLGTTVTNQHDMGERGHWLRKADARIKFISFEPLMGPISMGLIDWGFQWFIIGAMTGPGAVKPEIRWSQRLVNQATEARVPLFLKDNLNWSVKIQEFPA